MTQTTISRHTFKGCIVFNVCFSGACQRTMFQTTDTGCSSVQHIDPLHRIMHPFQILVPYLRRSSPYTSLDQTRYRLGSPGGSPFYVQFTNVYRSNFKTLVMA